MSKESKRRNLKRRAKRERRRILDRARVRLLTSNVPTRIGTRIVSMDAESSIEASELSQQLLRDLKELGVPIPPGSRFVQYDKIAQRHRNSLPKTDQEIRELLASRMEVQMLAQAVSVLSEPPTLTGWLGKVSCALRGLPHDGAEHDPARDAQAELWFGSTVRRTGFDIRIDEPDLVVAWRNSKIGLAVKRPRSLKSLPGALRKAVRQFGAHELTGVIAVDLTLVLGFDSLIGPGTPEALVAKTHRLRTSFLATSDFQRAITERTEGKRISALLGFSRIAHYDEMSGSCFVVFDWVGKPLTPLSTDPASQFASELSRCIKLDRGWANTPVTRAACTKLRNGRPLNR